MSYSAPTGSGPPIGFWAEVRDAVAPRTVALVVGVLAIQLLFIASYVDAFHKPEPHEIPIAVVAPKVLGAQVVEKLNKQPGNPVQAMLAVNRASAAAAVRSDNVAGAIIVNPNSTTDTLLVASGGGYSLTDAVEQIAEAADASEHRTVAVEDLVPLQAGDAHGLTGFYLVVGWIVGGYLVAALLGVASGARPATTRRALIRLLAIFPYAVISGFAGALIVDQGLGALTGHFLTLAGVGMLLVAAAATTTLALQVLLGVIGIGITVLVFVVAGNPSAGGAYQSALLPGFFSTLNPAIPNGAGVDTVRRIVYFGSQGIATHLVVICTWIFVGSMVTLIGSIRNDKKTAFKLRPPRVSGQDPT
jgi:hypothetical protein